MGKVPIDSPAYEVIIKNFPEAETIMLSIILVKISEIQKNREKPELQTSATLLVKRLWHWCFPVNFATFSSTLVCRTPPGDCLWRFTNSKEPKCLDGVFRSFYLDTLNITIYIQGTSCKISSVTISMVFHRFSNICWSWNGGKQHIILIVCVCDLVIDVNAH